MYFGRFHPTLPSSPLSLCGGNSFCPQICLLLSYLCFVCDPLLSDWDAFMNMGGVVYCAWYNFPVATPLKKMISPLPAIVNYQKLLKEGWGSQVPTPSVLEGWSHLVQVFAYPICDGRDGPPCASLCFPNLWWREWSTLCRSLPTPSAMERRVHLVQVFASPVCDGGDGPSCAGLSMWLELLWVQEFNHHASLFLYNYFCFSWMNLNQISGIIKFHHP